MQFPISGSRIVFLTCSLAALAFGQKNVTGEWGPLISWPHIPVHVGQMTDGRLVTWSSTRPTTFPAGETFTHAAIFDPATNAFTNLPNTAHDMFCTGIATTADGRIIASGGGASVRTTSFIGNNARWGQNWVQAGTMQQGRWYNTSVTLPDGRVLTWWGRDANGIAEAYNPNTGIWTSLPGINVSGTADPNDNVDDDNRWYPHLHVAPDGRVFQAGPLKTLRMLDPTGSGSFVNVGTRTPDGDRHRKLGFSVMYRPGLILFTGGRDDRYTPRVTNTSVILNINGPTPVTTAAAPMNYARAFHYGVMMPNGELFVAAGNTSGTKFSDSGGVLAAEIWNPDTNQWRILPNMAEPRGYHTVGVLLRDGRILVGGGGLCGCGADHQNAQIYSPGYLFSANGTLAPRPTLSAMPVELKAGLTVTATGSDDIASFSMIRLQGTTHGLNSDQRYLPLSFTRTAPGQYSVTLPASENTVIPGWYWVFANNANGVPSLGYAVQVYATAAWPGLGGAWVNLARNKSAAQSSTFETAAAARAVDGNQNGTYANGSVSHTNSEPQPYWQVDLGGSASLKEIRLWNRADCCADRLANFHVFVSDAPFAGPGLAQVRSQPGVLDLAFPGTAGPTVVFGLNRTGRYVRVQLEGSNALQLAEVEVLGTAIPNRPPTVSLTGPANNSAYTAPASITLTADAADPDGNLAKVEFYQGATKLGEDATAPYSFAWSNVAAGSYSLTARAVDTAGLTAQSTAVNITVTAPNRPPTVSLTAPANNSAYTAPASITLTADAADPDGNLAKVEFYQGATKLGEDATAPYSFAWSNAAAGSYSLTARAVDTAGLTAQSTAVNITVNPPAGNQAGLTGDYYGGSNFQTLRFSRTDAVIDFNWGTAGPGNGLTGGSFSVKWSGKLEAAATAEFTLCVSSDDGMRLYLNNTLVADSSWNSGRVATSCGAYAMTQGTKYDLRAEHFNAGGASAAQLRWWYPGGAFEVIPSRYLSTGSAPGQNPPVVSIASPVTGAQFTAPANIAINVNASDADNNLTKVEFFQGATKLGEDATAPYTFNWTNVAAGSYSITARATDATGLTANATVSILVTAAGANGLTGEYYPNLTFTNLGFTRIDPVLDFNFGTAGPGAPLNGNQYTIRWTGKLTAPATSQFVFCAESDDGVRVTLEGQVVADSYYPHGLLAACGVANLTSGRQYALQVDYFNDGGTPGQVRLKWWYPGGPFEVIPTGRLLPR